MYIIYIYIYTCSSMCSTFMSHVMAVRSKPGAHTLYNLVSKFKICMHFRLYGSLVITAGLESAADVYFKIMLQNT